MQITEVKVRKLFEEGPLKAVASVTLDNCFVVHDVKVVEAKDKLFIVMPATKTKEGVYRDTVHPVNASFRKEFTDAVLEQYTVQRTLADTK